jgi:transposase
VKDADAKIKTLALVAAISEDCGLEAFSIYPRSINSENFVAFVQLLSQRFGGQEFAVFMDNLQVHKTKEVVEACKALKVQAIFNVPYSPDFNGIESYFSLVKGQYKKLILQ